VSKRRFPEGVPVDVAVLQEKFNDVERAIKLIAELEHEIRPAIAARCAEPAASPLIGSGSPAWLKSSGTRRRRSSATARPGALSFQALDAIRTRYLKRPGALA
jgi:hypothetical protein